MCDTGDHRAVGSGEKGSSLLAPQPIFLPVLTVDTVLNLLYIRGA